MVQWLRICFPKEGTWVRSPVWEDSTWYGATKPVLRNKRSHRNKKPMHPHLESSPHLPQLEKSPRTATMSWRGHSFFKKGIFLFLATWLKNDDQGYLEMGAWTLTPVEQKKQPRDED